MNTAVMFSHAKDEWTTPIDMWLVLDHAFNFGLDAAANLHTALCPLWFGPDHPKQACRNALTADWASALGSQIRRESVWLNPPYSQVRDFIAKALEESNKGCTVVCLVPARTDTFWWHLYVWDGGKHQPRPGVEVRFLKGRLKFGGSKNSAPFPSVIVIFRPVEQ